MQIDQSSLPGGLDLASLPGPSHAQEATQGDDTSRSWPFGLESELLGGGVNPSQVLSDPFADVNNPLYAPAGSSSSDHIDHYACVLSYRPCMAVQ